MVCVFAGLVVRDILRPERDVVRESYEGEDPDGGLLLDEEDELDLPPWPGNEPALAR
jgi:hypothetical protein